MIRLDAWMRPGELDQTLSSNLSYCQPPNLFGSLACAIFSHMRLSRRCGTHLCDSCLHDFRLCATLTYDRLALL